MIKYFKNLEKILSLKDKVYQVIKLEIIGGNLKPGLFLAEEKLSESMHISRGPIREALNILEQEGFVTIIPRRGTMVSNITAQEVKDISKIRELLEPFAAKESIKDHLYIIEAIEKNEEDLVATTLIRHLERVKNSILSEITS